jgi:hypothetical protein
MGNSKSPGPLRPDPHQVPPRTPGPLGINDAGTPFLNTYLAPNTPGPVGRNDCAAQLLVVPQEKRTGQRSKTLHVPYFHQPTSVTCQSTVLKMFATYLASDVLHQSSDGADEEITNIWNDINTGDKRPVQLRNAHKNMKWWLEQHFPMLEFEYSSTTHEDVAMEQIVGYIDSGFPVLVAVSHARVEGHIVLVVGYENYQPLKCSDDFALIIHDPYGKFDPHQVSDMFGVTGTKRGLLGGSSLMCGGETGPGMANRLPLEAASRQRKGDKFIGTFYLLSVKAAAASAACAP